MASRLAVYFFPALLANCKSFPAGAVAGDERRPADSKSEQIGTARPGSSEWSEPRCRSTEERTL